MNILMLDISGKVTKYTFWVSNALYDNLQVGDSIKVYASMYKSEEKDYSRFLHGLKYKKLLNLIPLKYKRSFSLFKRLVKSLEVLINYIYIIFVVKCNKIDVLHTQYIPFADFISIEYHIYKIIKRLSPRTKLVLTIHDVLPHDLKPENKETYCKRYRYVASIFDEYMVHTKSCKRDVINYLQLPESKIHIAYHPIFMSAYVKTIKNIKEIKRPIKMIMFGLQTPYKGTDILIDAMNLLPKDYASSFKLTIAGAINDDYFSELKKKSGEQSINWFPYFVPEKDLDEMINDSEIIVLPYRSISQSGVLLLSIYFHKLIITSDLPTFKESLDGYNANWFFESGNPVSLAQLLKKIADGEIDVHSQQSIMDDLNNRYSLGSFSKATITAYTN